MTSVRNPASNFSNLAFLTTQYLAFEYTVLGETVQNAINDFLNDINEENYNTVLTAFTAANASLATGKNSSLRILATTADGTVFYDSSKRNNSFANFTSKSINENHQNRPEILLAVLSSTGVGLADRYSTSVKGTQKYQATRLGDSTNENVGTFRASLDDNISV
jgi:hypothetical protein